MCVVGLSGMSVQFIVYHLCRNYLLPFNSMQISVTLAIINNFILNNHLTFKNRKASSQTNKIRSMVIFLLYSLVYIYLQSYWQAIGVRLFGEGLLTENIIIFFGMLLGSMLNYFVYSRFVWRDRDTRPASAPLDNNIS
jgi:dolichol-phosphate mannosyltransferase